MAKLAEAQKCQDEIIRCNNELQQVDEAIAEVCNIFNAYKTKAYLNHKHTTLNNGIKNLIRERDEKLNEALSKALDLADDETDKGMFNVYSLSAQALGTIYSYVVPRNIHWQYSIEVDAKFAKIFAKGINAFNQFPNQQRMFGNL
ncbi:MAG: hypothetical protein J1E58_05550 [Prevotella sp.]|nr:hypothetical protein [Prevotella sp.]